jgi:hypothetical protein
MWINMPVINNTYCATFFGNGWVIDSTICTEAPVLSGPNWVSYVQCLTYRGINFSDFQHIMHHTSLVVRWTEFLRVYYEVPGSMPVFKMGNFFTVEDSNGDLWLGSWLEFRFKFPPGILYPYITIRPHQYNITKPHGRRSDVRGPTKKSK